MRFCSVSISRRHCLSRLSVCAQALANSSINADDQPCFSVPGVMKRRTGEKVSLIRLPASTGA